MADERSSAETSANKVSAFGASLQVSDGTATAIAKFLGEAIGQPLADAVGYFGGDWLRVKRAENMAVLIDGARKRLRARGIEHPTTAIPVKFAVPLLEAASLEEDATLRSLWENLLANSLDGSRSVAPSRSYVDVLAQLSPVEARILETIYSQVAHPYKADTAYFSTAALPESAVMSPADTQSDPPAPPADMLLPLSNLSRLNCLRGGTTWDGGEHYGFVFGTYFGAAFYRAVSGVTA